MDLEISTRAPVEERRQWLRWHKPAVLKLTVSLDTGNENGSFSDGLEHSDIPVELESDVRLKKDISPIEGALHGVLSLRGVEYFYDSAAHPELGLREGPQLGFIAQELEAAYPQLVRTKPHGFKSINYAQLVPVLVEAIKEQQAMISDLQNQVKQLKPASKS